MAHVTWGYLVVRPVAINRIVRCGTGSEGAAALLTIFFFYKHPGCAEARLTTSTETCL